MLPARTIQVSFSPHEKRRLPACFEAVDSNGCQFRQSTTHLLCLLCGVNCFGNEETVVIEVTTEEDWNDVRKTKEKQRLLLTKPRTYDGAEGKEVDCSATLC